MSMICASLESIRRNRHLKSAPHCVRLVRKDLSVVCACGSRSLDLLPPSGTSSCCVGLVLCCPTVIKMGLASIRRLLECDWLSVTCAWFTKQDQIFQQLSVWHQHKLTQRQLPVSGMKGVAERAGGAVGGHVGFAMQAGGGHQGPHAR